MKAHRKAQEINKNLGVLEEAQNSTIFCRFDRMNEILELETLVKQENAVSFMSSVPDLTITNQTRSAC